MRRRCAAEAVGTAFLLAIVVGSGIMGERLAGGNIALALLANSLATGAGLAALIVSLAPVSGAHFNPAVSLVMAMQGELAWRALPAYVLAQCLGAVLGVIAAHAMFDLPMLEVSGKLRPGPHLIWAEFVATAGLLLVILGAARHRAEALPWAVGGYITAAYWFTASTSFANPAVTLARTLTDTFSGVAPASAPGFIAAQTAAALACGAILRWQRPSARRYSARL
jgi:glycerol uptake facilitator-like aquaporin